MDGTDENCGKIGADCPAYHRNTALIVLSFSGYSEKHEARQYIATNFIANILGLGWACTPAGLKAMEALAKLEEERGTPGFGNRSSSVGYAGERSTASGLETGCSGERVASREMCTFLILNTSSLQLIPVNMIVYRTQYGSASPAAVIAPAILATFVSTAAAIVFCLFSGRRQKRR